MDPLGDDLSDLKIKLQALRQKMEGSVTQSDRDQDKGTLREAMDRLETAIKQLVEQLRRGASGS